MHASSVVAMPESVFQSNAVTSVAAAASATVVRGEHDGEAMAQIESDALIAKTMQEEWDDVNGENCVGRVGGGNSIVDDRKRNSNPASETATSDTEGVKLSRYLRMNHSLVSKTSLYICCLVIYPE